MGAPLFGSPPKPYGFPGWEQWAAALADYLELQGSNLADLSLTGLAAAPIVLGYQQIVGAVAATAITVPSGTTVAFIQAEMQSVRWRDDGTDPTATIGNIIEASDTLMYAGDFSKLRLIEVAPTAVINIESRR